MVLFSIYRCVINSRWRFALCADSTAEQTIITLREDCEDPETAALGFVELLVDQLQNALDYGHKSLLQAARQLSSHGELEEMLFYETFD